jgi:choline-glycine betaine transporter
MQKSYRMIVFWSVLIVVTAVAGLFDSSLSLATNGFVASALFMSVVLLMIEIGYQAWKQYIFGGQFVQQEYLAEINDDSTQYIPRDNP